MSLLCACKYGSNIFLFTETEKNGKRYINPIIFVLVQKKVKTDKYFPLFKLRFKIICIFAVQENTFINLYRVWKLRNHRKRTWKEANHSVS